MIVSIVGKPNVGKSTLFNKLSVSNRSLVHPTPGLTRDCLDTTVYRTLTVPIEIRDTPGIQYLEDKDARRQFDDSHIFTQRSTYTPEQYDEIAEQMLRRTKESIEESNLIFFMVDGKTGISEQDRIISRWLRSNFPDKPTFMLANKIDNPEVEIESYNDVYSLGFEDPIFVAAEGGDNLHAVWEKIQTFVTPEKEAIFEKLKAQRKEKINEFKKKFIEEIKGLMEKDPKSGLDSKTLQREFDYLNRDLHFLSDLDDPQIPIQNLVLSPKVNDKVSLSYYNRYKNLPIKIALLGRPNAGKSTVFNFLLKEERSVVHDIAHTTKDPVVSKLVYKGRRLEIIDTAGIDRALIRDNKSADYGVFYRNLSVLREAQVHVLVVDAMNAFRVKDMDLLQKSLKEGRGLIILVNKWDLVDPKWHQKAISYMKNQIKMFFSGENGCPIFFGSAKSGKGLEKLLDSALGVYENWNLRVSTSLLNAWLVKLKRLTNNDYESLIKKQQVLKIRFITQVKTRPPSFTVWVNDASMFKPHIVKFIKNKLVEEFKIYGVGVKLKIRETNKLDFRRRLNRILGRK